MPVASTRAHRSRPQPIVSTTEATGGGLLYLRGPGDRTHRLLCCALRLGASGPRAAENEIGSSGCARRPGHCLAGPPAPRVTKSSRPELQAERIASEGSDRSPTEWPPAEVGMHVAGQPG